MRIAAVYELFKAEHKQLLRHREAQSSSMQTAKRISMKLHTILAESSIFFFLFFRRFRGAAASWHVRENGPLLQHSLEHLLLRRHGDWHHSWRHAFRHAVDLHAFGGHVSLHRLRRHGEEFSLVICLSRSAMSSAVVCRKIGPPPRSFAAVLNLYDLNPSQGRWLLVFVDSGNGQPSEIQPMICATPRLS